MFKNGRSRITYANLDTVSTGQNRVKTARAPRYMGANIIPSKGSGAISANVTGDVAFTATLAISSSSGSARYVDAVNGTVQAVVESGEEASLVVVNTPVALRLFDPFKLTADDNRGLNYQLQLSGAAA